MTNPVTPEAIAAALAALPANVREVFASLAPVLEPDDGAPPPVIVWPHEGRAAFATPWKPCPELFGDAEDPTSYRGIMSCGRAQWSGALGLCGTRPIGGWLVRPAEAAAVAKMLADAGWDVKKARDTAHAMHVLQVEQAKQPQRLAKPGRRGKAHAKTSTATAAAPTLDLSAIPDAEVAADPRA